MGLWGNSAYLVTPRLTSQQCGFRERSCDTAHRLCGIITNFLRWVITTNTETTEGVLTQLPRNLVSCVKGRQYLFEEMCIFCEGSCLKIDWKVQIFGNNLNQSNSIQDGIKSRLKSDTACYHSVQNLLSSSLLSKNLKIKTYRTIILLVVYGCETWSLTLREERGLKVFENMVLRRIFGHKRDEVTGD